MRWVRPIVALAASAVLAFPAPASGSPADLIVINTIRFDPPGADDGSNSSLNGEYVVIENTGGRAVTLSGWTVRDTDRHVYRFPSFRLGSGAQVRIHTGSGSDSRRDLYWGSDGYVWNNDGDTAILRDDRGRRIDLCRYTGAGSSVTCEPAG